MLPLCTPAVSPIPQWKIDPLCCGYLDVAPPRNLQALVPSVGHQLGVHQNLGYSVDDAECTAPGLGHGLPHLKMFALIIISYLLNYDNRKRCTWHIVYVSRTNGCSCTTSAAVPLTFFTCEGPQLSTCFRLKRVMLTLAGSLQSKAVRFCCAQLNLTAVSRSTVRKLEEKEADTKKV